MPTGPKRVKDIFLEAAELPDDAARAVYLDRACGADAGLRERVEALFRSHDPDGSFLGTPAAVIPGPDHAATRAFEPDPDHAATRTGGGSSSDDEVPLGFLAPATRPDSLGRIGHYEVLQVIGQGGFGIVFRAFDEVLHRVVAVKVLAPQLAATSPARKRFVREARSSAQVRHENVVQVYEVGETPLPYIAMEFIPGETLQERLNRIGPVEPAEVVRIGHQIAEGLAAAHATDLIHRDIKPGNVLLEGGAGRVKITDFGLARAADDASISQSGIIAGTPMYMAPEQALGAKLDQRADLFSLGSVLYQMAAGRAPFRANSTVAVLKRVAEDTPRDIREIVPEVPQWLCDIISKLHAKNPDERYQSAREVADVLADCEAQLKANAKLKDFSRIPRSARPARAGAGKWKRVAAAVLLLPVIALAMTESTGVTHLFRGQQATPDPVMNAEGAGVRREPPADKGTPTDFTNTVGMQFKLIPAGKFTMGSPKEEIDGFLGLFGEDGWRKERVASEGPEHVVEITEPFYTGTTQVTVEQFRQFVDGAGYQSGDARWRNLSVGQTDNHPVVWVSWENAVDFCNWLSKKEGKTYRLPTEAEWEYSCRAGKSGTRYCYGDDDGELKNYAWYKENSGGGTHPVGKKKPNEWGLYDMHGNVGEWCHDRYDPNYYKTSPKQDPPGPGAGDERVLRGGTWGRQPFFCRSAFRNHDAPESRYDDIGFRVVLVGDLKVKTPPIDVAKKLPPTFKNGIGMEFVIVPKGKSWLGGGKDKLGDKEVEIPADFYLGKYEVTQEEWTQVMGENPSHFSRSGGGKDAVKDIPDADLKRFPVETVSWDQCQLFVAKLNKLEKETGWVYRLPKEVEWEYACRGGPMADKLDSAFDFYFAKPTNTLLLERANFNKGLNRARKVGSYEANRLGLFDMHGNVLEWCDDSEKVADGASHRVRQGGGWDHPAGDCLAALRIAIPPSDVSFSLGLRLARVRSDTKWGNWIDPLGDCRLAETDGRMTITVPGGNHDLSPNPKGNMHAPRVLREVEGDFEVRVTIPAIAPQPVRYFAAGLVVWCDEAPTFLRFMLGGSSTRRLQLHTESWSGTEYHGIKTTDELPEGPTQFRIRRTGDSLQLAWSQDGQAWIVLEPKAGPKLPARVRVGVAAINMSDQELAVPFEGFTVQGETAAPFTDADVQRIRGLSAEQQVEEVRKELMRLNPGFDGKMETKIENGVVTELRIVTDTVTDIAPIRVFKALRALDCSGTWTNKDHRFIKCRNYCGTTR